MYCARMALTGVLCHDSAARKDVTTCHLGYVYEDDGIKGQEGCE
jgi:hypothetical protein